jgi:hypothetical protein
VRGGGLRQLCCKIGSQENVKIAPHHPHTHTHNLVPPPTTFANFVEGKISCFLLGTSMVLLGNLSSGAKLSPKICRRSEVALLMLEFFLALNFVGQELLTLKRENCMRFVGFSPVKGLLV